MKHARSVIRYTVGIACIAGILALALDRATSYPIVYITPTGARVACDIDGMLWPASSRVCVDAAAGHYMAIYVAPGATYHGLRTERRYYGR